MNHSKKLCKALNLTSLLDSPVIYDDNFQVTRVSFFFLLLILTSQIENYIIFHLHCCIESFHFDIILKQNKLQYSQFLQKIQKKLLQLPQERRLLLLLSDCIAFGSTSRLYCFESASTTC